MGAGMVSDGFLKNSKRTVDTFVGVCRMRISLEAHTGYRGLLRRVNCLKVVKKTFLRFFKSTVDRVAIHCRMRPTSEGHGDDRFFGFSATV